MGERLTVRLVGGGPWGFRLQGGTGTPLTVSKIRRRSRAQHHLAEGDRILSINGVSCEPLNYDQAMSVVDNAENALLIEIIRGGAGGKENRDPSATAQPPKELATKEKVSTTTTTVKTKTKESVVKSSGSFDSVGICPQTPRLTDAPKPSAMAPAAPTPPPTTTRTVTAVQAPVPTEPVVIPEVQTFAPAPTTFAPETKPFPTSAISTPKPPPDTSGPPAVAPNVQPLASGPSSFAPEGPLLASAHLAKPLTTSFEQKPSLPVQEPLPELITAAPVQLPEAPAPKFMNLAPELQALAPELAALDTELAAFENLPSRLGLGAGDLSKGHQPEKSERREEKSMETTSDGQRYHSLTTETSSWSEGQQHKASSFQQKEETKEFRTATDDESQRSGMTVQKETKTFRSSKVESSSAQNQLSPDLGDSLSWRPTSPIFQKPLQPPPTFSRVVAPSPPPPYSILKTPVKETPAPAVWSPPSASAAGPIEKKKKLPPPTPPKPSRKPRSPPPTQPRPISAPPRDYDIWNALHDTDLPLQVSGSRVGRSTEYTDRISATSDSEDWYHQYGPLSSEDEMGSTSLLTRRKKMFSSSSFYEEPHSIYPTVEEQVELARKIAGSLSNDNNKKSRGANMFFKRVKRSHTWIHEGPDPYSDGGTTDTDLEPTTPDPGSGPFIKVSSGPPKLKLILDPRQLQDYVKLKSSGSNPVEHTAISPDICMDLVRDLNSPRGKGAALFAKRKQKALDWVVDGEKVKSKMAQKNAEVAQMQQEAALPFGPSFGTSVVLHNRLKLIKSPWEAALESPIGSCDSAFVELPPVSSSVASSIIRAAENKARIAPVAASYTEAPFSLPSDVYTPKAPRGWMGSTTGSIPSIEREPLAMPFSNEAPSTSQSMKSSSGTARPLSFHDFNSVPRSWSGAYQHGTDKSFRPVRAFK